MSDENRQSPETEEDIYNAFLEVFDAVAPDTPEEIDEFLREKGYDPDELAKSARSIFKEALETSPLNWRNRARQELEDAKSKLAHKENQPKVERSRKEIIAAIAAIQQKRGPAVAAHFRKLDLDKVSDEDLASMLADLEHLEAEDDGLDG